MNKLTLPNLTNKSDTRLSYNINDREYMFHFKWCDTFCIVDIYLIENNTNNYLIKSVPLTLTENLIARVRDNNLISGSLFFLNRYNAPSEPSQDDFYTDYYLLYTEE